MIVQPKERTVRVVRSFEYRGTPTVVGDKLALPTAFAHEMRHAGKVEFVDPDPVPIRTEPATPPNAIPPERLPEKPKGK